MSRTYRTHLDWRYHVHGVFYSERDESGLPYEETRGWRGEYFVNRSCPDRKPWGKPPKWYKKMNRRIERARMKGAVRTNKEVIPFFKQHDAWDWT